MVKRSNIFWGILLVILAALLLLNQLELVIGQIWDYFWPAALMLTGIWMLIGFFRRRKPTGSDTIEQELGSARRLSVKIDHGAGRLNLHGNAPAGKALFGSCHGGLEVQKSTNGDVLDLRLRTPSQFWEWAPGIGLDWDLAFSDDVPLKLKIHSGASHAVFDFSALLLTDLKLDTGASSTFITMPEHAGSTIADIDTGVSSVKIIIPKNVSAHIRVKTGISALQINKERFTHIEQATYQSPDYATSTNRLDLSIDSGVGSVVIE